MTSWADQKAAAQRQVHETFAVRCIYRDNRTAEPVTLSARLHTRIVVGGNEGNAGYATIIEGVSRVLFDKDELRRRNVVPKRNAIVTFPDYGSSYALDVRDPTQTNLVTDRWALAGL